MSSQDLKHLSAAWGRPAILLTFLASLILIAPPATLAADAALSRVAATSLKLSTTAPTYGYTTEPAFPGLTFDTPTQVLFASGESHRAFVVELGGRIFAVGTGNSPARTVFLDLTPRLGPDRGILSMVFHPRFAENGYFYLWYSLGTERVDRLSRFRVLASDPSRADPDSEQPLITQPIGPGGHEGGQLQFGPDGYLYLSLGDGSDSAAAIASRQHIDESFFGAILRIDVDQRPENLLPNPHSSVHPGTYRIPADNPFIAATTFNGLSVSPARVRTEFWAVGFRNPFRIAFDEPTGLLWCGDVGLDTKEEINLVVPGGNYGWDYREGSIAGPRGAASPSGFTSLPALLEYDHSLGASITGGLVYRGVRFPELQGRYLFADFVSGRVWALTDDGSRPLSVAHMKQIALESGIVSFAVVPGTGDILLADLDSNEIRRVVAAPATSPLPATLSDTGVFSDVASLTPAAGVVAYAPNVSFWSDYAKKTRWFALPDLTSRFTFSATGNWSLPTGAVWVKHFDLEQVRGNPSTSRRIETRILVKTADGIYGLSYRWNDAQTNAVLVGADGEDQAFQVTENGTVRTQTWHFPGRGECASCHTPQAGYALSFNTRQLNRTFDARADEQLAALAAAGYLDVASIPPLATLPKVSPAADTTKTIEDRARSYLDVNCAQCHQPGGIGRGSWDARYTTATAATGILYGSLMETRGDSANRVLMPGDTVHSMIHRRVEATDGLRMPPIGSREVDREGVSLLKSWIEGLGSNHGTRLVNLSVRTKAGASDQTLIMGFVVEGAEPAQLLVRALGPTLKDFGVTTAIADPALKLFDATARNVDQNNDWGGGTVFGQTFARVGAAALNAASKDSALLLSPGGGAYSAHVTGAGGSTGTALVELYDIASHGAGRLINASARSLSGSGEDVLILGFVLEGQGTRTLLIRGVGPTLAASGVSGALADPVLKVYRNGDLVAENDNWQGNLLVKQAFSRTGAFSFVSDGSKDAALLLSLEPGVYNAHVTGAGGSSGVALVELYEVPTP